MDCAVFELLLADAVENILPETVAAEFAAHAASCALCRERLEQACQGHAWLNLLKQQAIEPPTGLVERILARTSDAATIAPVSAQLIAGAIPQPQRVAPRLWKRPTLIHLRRTVMDPRLALTAAMAFFSISLTLNLLGVRLTGMKAADLAPQNLRRTVTRQYVQANSRVVRYYENLRFVYEVESRVQELRRAAETPEPAGQPKQKQDKSSSGSSSEDSEPHRAPLARTPYIPGRHSAPENPVVQVPLGPLMDAALRLPENANAQRFRSEYRIAFPYDAMEKRSHGTSRHPFHQNFKELMTSPTSFLPCETHWSVPERSAV